MDAAAESGRNPVTKHQIQPECGDKQAAVGRDGRICLARPNSREEVMFLFPCLADHEQDWQPHLIDPYFAINDSTQMVPTSEKAIHALTGELPWGLLAPYRRNLGS